MSGAPHPFEEVLAAGAKVVELIIGQSAAGGSDAIFAEVEKPSRAQVYAALIVMALVDRDLQRGPVRFDLEVPALDRLSMAAAEGLEPLRAAAVELDEAAAAGRARAAALPPR